MRFKMCNLFNAVVVVAAFLLLGPITVGNCVAFGSPSSSSESTMHTNNSAVLVCTSRFWFNYQHMANTLSLYRLELLLCLSFLVPVTNFFGSVLETIRTDSAYKALSRKSFSRAEIKTPFDKTINGDERRTLADSDCQDQLSDLKKEDQQGVFRHFWKTFNDKVGKIEDVDSFVQYGLLVMLPLLLLAK